MKRKPETSILSMRICKVDREMLVEEAKRSGASLSEYAFNLISQGIEAAAKSGRAGIQTSSGEASGKAVKPTVQPKESKTPGVQDGPVDDSFLTGVKARYPGLNHGRLMVRLGNVSRETGKLVTRKTVEKLFEIAAGQAGKR